MTAPGSVWDRGCLCLIVDWLFFVQVLLVSSSRHPDKWIVPGGGMEPEEEPSVAAVREVCEEASHNLSLTHSLKATMPVVPI